jgi:hypothetical protein
MAETKIAEKHLPRIIVRFTGYIKITHAKVKNNHIEMP